MEEENGMTNDQYVGVIKLIIKMIKEEVPKEKLLEYLEDALFPLTLLHLQWALETTEGQI